MIERYLNGKPVRERLNNKQRKWYRRNHPKKCEVTGRSLIDSKGRNTGEIHHIEMVKSGGLAILENLMQIDAELHKTIHREAWRIAGERDCSVEDACEYLSTSILELGKLGRVLEGEDPNVVYAREQIIDQINQLRCLDNNLEG